MPRSLQGTLSHVKTKYQISCKFEGGEAVEEVEEVVEEEEE